jgi:hypothetical protein
MRSLREAAVLMKNQASQSIISGLMMKHCSADGLLFLAVPGFQVLKLSQLNWP